MPERRVDGAPDVVEAQHGRVEPGGRVHDAQAGAVAHDDERPRSTGRGNGIGTRRGQISLHRSYGAVRRPGSAEEQRRTNSPHADADQPERQALGLAPLVLLRHPRAPSPSRRSGPVRIHDAARTPAPRRATMASALATPRRNESRRRRSPAPRRWPRPGEQQRRGPPRAGRGRRRNSSRVSRRSSLHGLPIERAGPRDAARGRADGSASTASVSGCRMSCGFRSGQRITGKWQAASWPGAFSSSGGCTSRHSGCARGQRGLKRHPSGGLSGLGTSPSSTIGVARPRLLRIGHRHRAEQRGGVRVARVAVESRRGAALDDCARGTSRRRGRTRGARRRGRGR